MKKFYLLVRGIAFAGLLITGHLSHAQKVLLDASFGNNGKVITASPFSNKYGMQANETVLQPDGKMVIAASSYYDLSVSDTSKFILIRYNTDGSLDTTFGTGGIAVTGINNKEDVATTLAIQPDGKIIAAGYTTFLGFYTDWAMVRYKNSGTLDSTFGTNGIVTISRGLYTEHIFSLCLKPDGKILAAGDATNATKTEVLQFNANGTPDSTFGINGVATIWPAMKVVKLLLQSDGKIAAAAYMPGTDTMSVVRFLATGQPDSSFGAAGRAHVLFTYGQLNSMSLQPDGKMILVGRASNLANNNTQVAVARLNNSGFIDSAFGINGKVFSLGGIDQGYRVIVRPDGKLIVAASKDKGFSYFPPVYGNFALLKYNSDGSPDSTFGKRGVVFTDFAGLNDEAYCIELQPDGKIVMAGFTVQNGKNNIALVRYQNAGLTYYNTIYASAFFDNNLNGIKEVSEPYFSQANISTIKPGRDTVSIATNGRFSVDVDTGSYITSVTPYHPYFNVVPSFYTTSHSSYFNADTMVFAVQPIAGKRDLEIQLVPLGLARPGFPVQYKIFLRNNGTDTIAADTIKFIKSSKLTFNSAYPLPDSVKGDTLRWKISNFKPFDTVGIVLYLTVKAPPVVNLGDTLISVVSIDSSANNLTPANDTSFLVQIARGAYDPNNKTENHGGRVTYSEVSNGAYLIYTINFQNTGTDTAFNVYIHDTLESKLDWNTLQMLTASHNYQITLQDGKCLWTFSNINLVDSNANEPASNGYLVYRIKPKSTVQIGDIITNKAAIYFDYNRPVLTNTESTTVVADVLPLKLLSFTAKRVSSLRFPAAGGTEVLLNWTTAHEVNVNRFEIERSTNPNNIVGTSGRDFIRIGMVSSELSAGSVYHYAFTDNNPTLSTSQPTGQSGSNIQSIYYRLKIIDKDGKFEYSPTRTINAQRLTLNVSIYPNPVKDYLRVQIESDRKEHLQLQVLSADGKVLMSNSMTSNEGTTLQSINMGALAKGNYLLNVIALNPSSGDKIASVINFEKM